LVLSISAMTTSMYSWKLISKRNLFSARCVQLVDNALWGSVPISVALLSTEPMGVSIGIAVHGMMACHWARFTRRSILYGAFVFGPPVVFLTICKTFPWVLGEGLFFMTIAIIFSRIHHARCIEDERRESRLLREVARNSYKAAEDKERVFLCEKAKKLKRDLAPAEFVRAMLSCVKDSDRDVSILCNSLDRAGRSIRELQSAAEEEGGAWFSDITCDVRAGAIPIEVEDGPDVCFALPHSDVAAVVDSVTKSAGRLGASSMTITASSAGGVALMSFFLVEAPTSVVMDSMETLAPIRRALTVIGGDLRCSSVRGVPVIVVEIPSFENTPFLGA
jgi:hypothetical protein